MYISLRLAVIVMTGIMGLQAISPVFAEEERGRGKSSVEVRAEASEKAGSRPGLLKKFLTRGHAAIGSGTVTAKNGTTLTVKDKDGKIVTVLTDSKTQFRRHFWGKGSLDEILVGHMVNVIGLWTDDAKTTIQARLVRDISVQKRFGVFIGIVQSLTANGWVMTTASGKRENQTVTVSSDTKFVNRKEEAIGKSDIIVGHRVRVKGLWDKENNTVTEVTHVKDFNLPVRATVTVTPTP